MVGFLGVLFAWACMFVAAPVPTLKVTGVFACLVGGVIGIVFWMDAVTGY